MLQHPISEASTPGLDAAVWSVRLGRGRKRFFLLLLQLSGEAAIIVLAVILAYLMKESWPASMGPIHKTLFNAPALLLKVAGAPEFRTYAPLLILAPALYLLLLQWMQLYRQPGAETRPFGGAAAIAKGTLLGTIFLGAFMSTYRDDMARTISAATLLYFLYLGILVFFGVLLFHSATLIGVLVLHAAGLGRPRAAVLRGAIPPRQLLEGLTSPASEYLYAGEITLEDIPEDEEPDPTWLGPAKSLASIINRNDLDEVILALDLVLLSTEQRLAIAQTCWSLGVELKMVTPFHPFFKTSAHPDPIGGVPILHVENLGIYATFPQMMKRAMDIAVSFTALIAASPAMLLTALAVKLDSPGPVFFIQERVGLNGRTFRMFKFRSMKTNADPAAHKEYLKKLIQGDEAAEVDANGKPVFKLARDPRITRVGRIIRKTSLDELPQLYNVLRGDMSLVGPRPPIQYEVDEYQDWHLRRLHIRPGITGLWQVSGRSRLSFDQMVQLDIQYIERWSLWFDIKILVRTAPVLLNIDLSY